VNRSEGVGGGGVTWGGAETVEIQEGEEERWRLNEEEAE
jgi:hypothetical protein